MNSMFIVINKLEFEQEKAIKDLSFTGLFKACANPFFRTFTEAVNFVKSRSVKDGVYSHYIVEVPCLIHEVTYVD